MNDGHVERRRGEAAENSSVLWYLSTVNVKNMRGSVRAKALDAQINKGCYDGSVWLTPKTPHICSFATKV